MAEPTAQEPTPAHGVDTDSTCGEDDVSTYTASLTSSVLNFPSENGRRYHAFREGTYVFPNDEPEQDRMDIHREMYVRACSGKLHLAPLTNTKSKRILDLGTGTGIRCVEMGDIYPNAEVRSVFVAWQWWKRLVIVPVLCPQKGCPVRSQ